MRTGSGYGRDLPIIVFAALPEEALAGLGIAGGAFLMWLGVEALQRGAVVTSSTRIRGSSGSRSASRSSRRHHRGGAIFLVVFCAMLVGSKVVVAALLAAGCERLLAGRGYRWALRGSGVLLLRPGAP